MHDQVVVLTELSFDEYLAKRDDLIQQVFAEVREEETLLLHCERNTRQIRYSGIFLLAAITANGILYMVLQNYLLLWIISSFLFYMFHPAILMVPRERFHLFPDKKIRERFFEVLSEIGAFRGIIREHRIEFWRMVWDIFFINSQPLAPPFFIIFSLDLIAAMHSGFLTSIIDVQLAILISLQSLAIIIFFTIIWKLKPYSPQFIAELVKLRKEFKDARLMLWRPALRAIFGLAFLAGFSGFLAVAALLLPGITFGQILMQKGFYLTAYIVPLIVIFLSQVVFVRYIQSALSQNLLIRVGSFKLLELKEGILEPIQHMPATSQDLQGMDIAGLIMELNTLRDHIFRMRIYKPDCHDLFGFFPVYLLVPDMDFIVTLNRTDL